MDEQFATFDTDVWTKCDNLPFWSTLLLANNVNLIEGGGLRLTGDDTIDENELYPGAQIISNDQFLYGYFEVRCKMPLADSGVWPGFWMWPDLTWVLTKPELDVVEYIGGNGYYHGSWLNGVKDGGFITTGDITSDYHIFACRWLNGEIRYYFDGAEMAVNNTLIPSSPLCLLLQMDVGGYGGTPSPAEAFPANYDVDYVKVWNYTPLVWIKKGSVLSATLPAEDDSCYEPTLLYEGGVFKLWYSGEWETPGIFYATSADGETWTKQGLVLDGFNRSCVVKNGSTYWLYARNNSTSRIDLYTSADGINWTEDTAEVLAPGTGADWDAGSVENLYVWQEGTNDWRMIYEARATAETHYHLGYATSTDGKAWTKHASNPIGTGSGPYVKKVGSTYWMWYHDEATHSAYFPTDIYRRYSTDCITWVDDPATPVLSRTLADEGPSTAVGQVADPCLLEVAGTCYLFYDATTDGTQKSGAIHISLAKYAGTLAQLVATQEGE